MSDTLDILRDLVHDFRLAWRGLLVCDAAFQMLRAWLIAPLIALALAFILLRAGHVAVSNQEILGFLLTPLGGLYVVLLCLAATILFLVEQAGMLAVTAAYLKHAGESPRNRLTIRRGLRVALGSLWRIGRLGVAKFFLLLITLAPFAALALVAYFALLTQYDIYYYLNARPAVFWVAAGIGGGLLVAAATCGAILCVQWALALPIVLFEARSATSALAASRQRVRGAAWPIARLILGWGLGAATLGGIAAAGFRFAAARILAQFGNDSLILLGGLLALQAALLATISFVTSTGLTLIVHRLYRLRSPERAPAPGHDSPNRASDTALAPSLVRRTWWVAAAMVLFNPLTLWGIFAERVAHRPTVLVTAHRGFAKAAPENTLSALRKAIDVGADYAEIDVHLTRDGAVVLLHDRDLKRVAGDSRRLDQLTLDEVRQLDVGSWFSKEFAGEKVPTLAEAIDLCRGKIRLNIELKVFDEAEPVARHVAQIVHAQHFEEECIATSLSHDALLAVRRENPELPVGIIVGQSLGDLNQLPVDALSVRADHLSDDTIRSAHRAGRQVMVWGINGREQVARQLRRGVDNLITSDPELALGLRDRWLELTDHERLVVASRLLLGIGAE